MPDAPIMSPDMEMSIGKSAARNGRSRTAQRDDVAREHRAARRTDRECRRQRLRPRDAGRASQDIAPARTSFRPGSTRLGGELRTGWRPFLGGGIVLTPIPGDLRQFQDSAAQDE